MVQSTWVALWCTLFWLLAAQLLLIPQVQSHNSFPSYRLAARQVPGPVVSSSSSLSLTRSRKRPKTHGKHSTGRWKKLWNEFTKKRPRKLTDSDIFLKAALNETLKIEESIGFLDFDAIKNDPCARLYPIDSDRPLVATKGLVGFTSFMFGLQGEWPLLLAHGIKLSEPILRGKELHRIVTPIFLHSNRPHLVSNMDALRKVGTDVEKLFGPGSFLATYFVAGIAGNILSAIKVPNPSLGASGAVYGMFGARFVCFKRNARILGTAGATKTSLMGQSLAMAILSDIILNRFIKRSGLPLPPLDIWVHLGGTIFGAVMAFVFGPRLYVTAIPVRKGLFGLGAVKKRVIIDRPICRWRSLLGLQSPGLLESIQDKADDVVIQTSGSDLVSANNEESKKVESVELYARICD